MATLTLRAVMSFGFAAATAQGCTVPIFRYALDRWPAETWTLEAPRSAFTTEPLASTLRNLGGNSPLNLAAKPWPDATRTDARLSFPGTGEAGAAWTGPLTPAHFLTLTDSPARRELIRRILAGDSLVWVTVLSPAAAANDALTDRLRKRLSFVQSAAQLPEIDPNDPSSTLGPGPELKLQFSELTVPLLSDYDHSVAKAYGVAYDSFLPEKNLGQAGVAKRSAFVVDASGVIQYAESHDSPGTLPDFAAIKAKLGTMK